MLIGEHGTGKHYLMKCEIIEALVAGDDVCIYSDEGKFGEFSGFGDFPNLHIYGMEHLNEADTDAIWGRVVSLEHPTWIYIDGAKALTEEQLAAIRIFFRRSRVFNCRVAIGITPNTDESWGQLNFMSDIVINLGSGSPVARYIVSALSSEEDNEFKIDFLSKKQGYSLLCKKGITQCICLQPKALVTNVLECFKKEYHEQLAEAAYKMLWVAWI